MFTVLTTYMYSLFCGVCRLAVRWVFFIKVRFFTTKKDGSTEPTALESDGPYFDMMGQWPGPTINLKACVITYFYPAGYCYVLHSSTNSIQLACRIPVISIYSKTCVKRPLFQKDQEMVSKTHYRLTKVLLYIVVQTGVDPDQLASIIWAYTVLKTGCIHIQHGNTAIGTASATSVESDLGWTWRIYFDNVALMLHNVMLTSQKPCQHNKKCNCSKINSYKWSLCIFQ